MTIETGVPYQSLINLYLRDCDCDCACVFSYNEFTLPVSTVIIILLLRKLIDIREKML